MISARSSVSSSVTAIGELLIDFTCIGVDDDGYPTLAAHPGGAPGNLLSALNAYGCKTAMLGKVGKDAFGRLLIETLSATGIDASGVIADPEAFTTLAFVTIDKKGNRSFSFARKPGADTQLHFGELRLDLIDKCQDFHFGTLSLTEDPARTATKKAVEYAKNTGHWISFDPNLRKPLWDDLEEAKRQILWGLSHADIVKISDEEVEFLWGATPEIAADKLHDLGITLAFITLGPNGCFYSGNGFRGRVPAPKGIRPIDTTGAGDIFGGSMLSQLLQLGKPLNKIDGDDMRQAAWFGCCAASLSTERFGGISSVPSIKDVYQLCKSAL